jgi:hypothetical protein
MDSTLWSVVERFCRHNDANPIAFDAFAQLVEQNGEDDIRSKIKPWSEDALEQVSFLISATLDTIENPDNSETVLQCQGLYITGPQKSLLPLASREIPIQSRNEIGAVLAERLPEQGDIIIGSHIIPATWVHGFSWKQWRAGLARDAAMFQRPCKKQPKQAEDAQAWILPVFVTKKLFADVSVDPLEEPTGVSPMSQLLCAGIKQVLVQLHGGVPQDVWIHPVLAAAHCCWAHAKTIAICDWLKGVNAQAVANGQSILIEEAPPRGSVRVRESRTGRLVAELIGDASFPVDGTGMAIELSSR